MMHTQALRSVRLGIGAGAWRLAVGVLCGALLTALGALVRIPLPSTPVPLTLQTLFVPLAGAALGPGLGALSQVLYVALGLAGVPVLAGGVGGPSVFAGATAGYVLAFPLAAWAAGALLRGRYDLWRTALAVCVATGIIYGCGAGWLMIGFHLTPAEAFQAGVLPFLPGDLLKLIAAAGLIRSARAKGR